MPSGPAKDAECTSERRRTWSCSVLCAVLVGWGSSACSDRSSASLSPPVDLRFVGDVLLDSRPGQLIDDQRDPFAAVSALLEEADLAVGNLECPVATSGTRKNKRFTFRAKPSSLRAVHQRLDVVSLANNHSGDFGREALTETMHYLDAAGIAHFGAGHTLRNAHQAYVYEKNGVRVALLGYDEFKPRSFEAGANHPGVAWSDDEQVLFDIQRERASGADVIIPFFHWGWENEPTPSARQRRFARRLIDAGAAAVVGGHPHITQGAETYRGRPIVYSLGNFVFDLLDYPTNARGWGLQLRVDQAGVRDWATWAVDIDEQGVPRPNFGVATPCGDRETDEVRECFGLTRAP